MGLIFDREKKMHLVLDKEVLDEEYFGCHPCINTSTLLMKTSDVKEKILPALGHEYQVVELPTRKENQRIGVKSFLLDSAMM